MPRSVVITTGATVTFQQLLAQVVSRQFFDFLLEIDVSNLTIQYGNEIVDGINRSEKFISELFSELDINSLEPISYGKLTIVIIPFSLQISEILSQADLVITHAGTGSIMDGVRLNKKMIVVPNDRLMDNHQRQIANAFESNNYVKSLQPSQLNQASGRDLIKGLLNDSITLTTLPPPQNIVESIIGEELT